MKVKKVRIGIKDLKAVLDDFVNVGETIEQGKKVKKEIGVYFTSIEAFRRVLTPKRLELLHIIKTQKPKSINDLARLANRDVKNVALDVQHLEQIGLVEIEEVSRKSVPTVNYDKIALEIAV